MHRLQKLELSNEWKWYDCHISQANEQDPVTGKNSGSNNVITFNRNVIISLKLYYHTLCLYDNNIRHHSRLI